MPMHARPHGAQSQGPSEPFHRNPRFRNAAWSAVIFTVLCQVPTGASLASSPTAETIRASRAGRLQEPSHVMPGSGFTATPSDAAAVPATPTAPQPEAKVLPPTKVKGSFPRGLHPVIKHSMVEASRYLPEGWQLEFMNALRDAPGVWNGPHGKRDKTGGALAVDIWLVNPKGERLCNFQCRQNFEPYQTFMQMVKHIQDRDFPAYRNQGRWGGYFGGRYANDEMHYDLEPTPWTAAGNWEKGLFGPFAHFGKPGDVGRGMGSIAGYRLPENGTLASLETPAAVAPDAPPAKAQGNKVAVAAVAPAAKPVSPPTPVATALQPTSPVVQKVAAVSRIAPPQVHRMQLGYRQAQYRARDLERDDEDGASPRRRFSIESEQASSDYSEGGGRARFSDGEGRARASESEGRQRYSDGEGRVRVAQYRQGRRTARQMRDYGDD